MAHHKIDGTDTSGDEAGNEATNGLIEGTSDKRNKQNPETEITIILLIMNSPTYNEPTTLFVLSVKAKCNKFAVFQYIRRLIR